MIIGASGPSWTRLTEALRAFVGRRVPGPDVDDVLQEALLKIHRGIGRLEDSKLLIPWMYRVTRNTVADYHRHPSAAWETLSEVEVAADDLVESDSGERTALQSCILPFVDALPEPSRSALRAVELDGVRVVDAARLLGLPLPTAKSRVQRARSQLRRALEHCCRIERDARGRVVSCEWRGTGSGVACATQDAPPGTEA